MTIALNYYVIVHCYNNIKYFSFTSQSTLEQVGDIGTVSEVESDDVDREIVSHCITGEIVAAKCFNYSGCSVCKLKIETSDGMFGECSKCHMMMKMSKCPKSFTANVRVIDSKSKLHDVKMFNDVITKLIGELTDSMTTKNLEQKLLTTAPHQMQVAPNKGIAFSVKKI